MHDTPDKSSASRSPGRLAELLLKSGLVSPRQIEAATALQNTEQPNLTKALVDLGFVTEPAITQFLVKQLKLPHLSLQDYQINTETLKLIPRDLCVRYRLLPIDVLGKNLTLAMANPLDDAALAAVQAACPGYRLKSFVCTLSDFDRVAERLFRMADPAGGGSSEMSLASLGISAKASPKPAPLPPPPPPDDGEDATATMLFNEAMPRRPKPSGPLRSSLICLDGWELGREIELTGQEHTLGRSPDADTTVNRPMISREHARITRNVEYGQETFVITDLKSSNGTFVNNIPVTATILRHGDRIMLGDVLFKFVLLDEIEARFHKDVHHLYSIQKGTGLLPASAWIKALERALDNPACAPITACLIEMDNLHEIAQTRGRVASVIVTSDAGDLLERYLEKGDLPGDFGDGRIAVAFEGKSVESVFPKLEDFRRMVEAHHFLHKDDRFRTTVSIGLASASGLDSPDVVAALRGALDDAVKQGRNTIALRQGSGA